MMILETRSIAVNRGPSIRLSYPDLTLRPKEMCLLKGASGCGKTTLLSVIAGLLTADEGSVCFNGVDLGELKPRALDKLRGEKMGFVFQSLHLLPSLTLRQNIMLAADLSGSKAKAERAGEILSQLGLSARRDAFPKELSQGEQQRAAIARAVLNSPSLIIADEPTSALDTDNAMKVIELLQWQANQTGAALIVATHDDRITGAFQKIIPLDTVKQEAKAT
ncbi:MAG: ABC transporter ATP-binding protein [Micavibrio aeruginosavorus]|uniref:ABC transporter ATP-binding protein n=1 Tax=Micavibrio aeruginosavorus TaxID=349221 RepID=A0A2W5MWH5_9BACT|nr:MAG: ABC transporter ATP-binding protein [Micavibrio aeruginosavorus]